MVLRVKPASTRFPTNVYLSPVEQHTVYKLFEAHGEVTGVRAKESKLGS